MVLGSGPITFVTPAQLKSPYQATPLTIPVPTLSTGGAEVGQTMAEAVRTSLPADFMGIAHGWGAPEPG